MTSSGPTPEPVRRGSEPRRAKRSATEPKDPASQSEEAKGRMEILRVLRPAQLVLTAAGAAAVTVVLVVAIGRLAGFAHLGNTLNGAVWGWLGLCAVGQVGVFVGYAGAFRAAVVIDGGPATGTWFSLRVALAGFGLTQLVAAGGAAGMAFTFWVLRRLGFVRRDALVLLIALNTAVYLVFGGLGWLGAVAGLLDSTVPLGMAAGWGAGFLLVVALARWFTQPRRAGSWMVDGGSRLRRALVVGVTSAYWVRQAVPSTDGQRLLAWSLMYWLGDLVSLWAALRSFGVTLSVPAVMLAYCTGYLAQSVPIPLIATGGVDAATTFTLTAVGVPIEVALLGVVAHRVFAFWLPVIPGAWSATVLVRDVRPLNEQRGRLLQTVLGARK